MNKSWLEGERKERERKGFKCRRRKSEGGREFGREVVQEEGRERHRDTERER